MEKKQTESGVVRLINPEHKPLTKEKLCELSGLNLSDEQAQETVHAIHLFAKLLYELLRKRSPPCNDNQQIINLEDNRKQAA
jgi:hypothetical protein